MTPEERQQKIESYRDAYSALVKALDTFPKEMWQFRPSVDDWTIHEIVVHIADSETNSYIRCRSFISEPGTTVFAYDEVQWSKSLDYHQQSTEDALELFRWLRYTTFKLITQPLPDEVWSNTIYHSENGTMTLDDWLDVYERHIPEHVEQMNKVHEAWRNQ